MTAQTCSVEHIEERLLAGGRVDRIEAEWLWLNASDEQLQTLARRFLPHPNFGMSMRCQQINRISMEVQLLLGCNNTRVTVQTDFWRRPTPGH